MRNFKKELVYVIIKKMTHEEQIKAFEKRISELKMENKVLADKNRRLQFYVRDLEAEVKSLKHDCSLLANLGR